MLPTGLMHLVVRVAGPPLVMYADIDDPHGTRVASRALVGGARAAYYVRDTSVPVHSVGAMLEPGAAEILLGVPAGELADRHTPLEDMWGPRAAELRARLEEAGSLTRELDVFEAALAARVPRARGMHPAVAEALTHFRATAASPNVGAIVHESGYSHRRMIALFKDAVGLTPKLYGRVLRFKAAVERIASSSVSWAEVALDAGYADQAHFNRDFREFAGITPGQYRAAAPESPQHVPILVDARSKTSKTDARIERRT
jgi:AraC-like DNA-binding protein